MGPSLATKSSQTSAILPPAGGPTWGDGGGYDCNMTSRTCFPVPAFVAPTYPSLSACINGCRPDDAKPPYWRCNNTTARCEQSANAGTTQERCEQQCHDHNLCNGGTCQSQGVDGAGNATCGHVCTRPPPGPNCSAFSATGCSACLAKSLVPVLQALRRSCARGRTRRLPTWLPNLSVAEHLREGGEVQQHAAGTVDYRLAAVVGMVDYRLVCCGMLLCSGSGLR